MSSKNGNGCWQFAPHSCLSMNFWNCFHLFICYLFLGFPFKNESLETDHGVNVKLFLNHLEAVNKDISCIFGAHLQTSKCRFSHDRNVYWYYIDGDVQYFCTIFHRPTSPAHSKHLPHLFLSLNASLATMKRNTCHWYNLNIIKSSIVW